MKTYNSMKSSNVLWLGDIPEHWELKRNIAILAERNELSEQGEEQLLSLSQYTGITIRGKNAVKMGMHEAESLVGYKIVHENDIVMNIMLAWNGSTAKSQYNGIISPAYAVYHLIDNSVNPDYLHYLYKTPHFMQYFEMYSTGLIKSRLRLYPQSFLHLSTIVPPREEQDRIVRFLDWKVSEINRLINCRKRQIERLEELKKAVVSRAVNNTKWKSVSLKKCLYSISDIDHFMPQSVENGYPYVMTGDLMQNASDIDFLKCKQISQEDYFKLSKKSKPQKDDVIFARYATIGTVCYVDKDIDFLVSYSCVTLKHNNLILGKYLFYYLKSDTFMQNVNQYIKINTQGNVGMESIRNVKIPIPPIEEQQQIVAYLDEQRKKIDSAIANKQKQIETLQELKTRLISDVVTGKIDVREIEIPEYEYVEEETNMKNAMVEDESSDEGSD